MSGSGLIILLVLVAGGLVWFSRARARARHREAALARLAPLISGTVSAKDRRLRGTYRDHGVGNGSRPYLPHVRYTPALRLPQRHEQTGELRCEVELPRDTDPSPERFGELLDRALHVVEVNSKANPG